MKPKNSNYRSPHSIANGIDRLEFAERVSKEIVRALCDPECSCPIGARKQWAEMNQIERLAFVSAGLECFYWIYVARINKERSERYPSWENATIDQKVETAAGFCSFILGTQSEHDDFEGPDNREASPIEWVN
jgi:hypothetical protein